MDMRGLLDVSSARTVAARARRGVACGLLAAAAGWAAMPPTALAGPTNVTISGGAQQVSQTLPTGQGPIGLQVPLVPNSINKLLVNAIGDSGQTASQELDITQITLSDIVLASVQTTLLTPAQVQTLVANGTINLANPANYNVSQFDIVLTIKGQPVPISVAVPQPINQPDALPPIITLTCGSSTSATAAPNTVTIPCGGGGGGGGQVQDQIIMIPVTVSMPPSVPGLPPIPGVILIEGKIKTLKEFFDVKLMLSNVSSLFNLTDLTATVDLPAGALTLVTPASGPLVVPDLPPGTQQSGDFIVRGDQIGIYTVTVHFGGNLSGAILPQPLPFSGSAAASLEVRGPPQMAVTVSHPEYVTAGVPYTLTVGIKDTDTVLPALYASLSLDVGVDAYIIDPLTSLAITAPSVTPLGNILPGQSTSLSYQIMPLVTGPINSCTAGVSQNLSLSVQFTGGTGPACAIGTLPAQTASASGRPTVNVIPAPNTVGVSVDAPVVAIFSDVMLTNTITTGYTGATFLVTDQAGNPVAGSLRFSTLSAGNTVVIFTPAQSLAASTTYLVTVLPTIYNQNGLQLDSGVALRYTTGLPPPPVGTAPPTVTLSVDPPVSAGAVPQGQIVPLTVQTLDAANVTEIDLFLDGNFVNSSATTPAHFQLDTSKLVSGSTHALIARVMDSAGNSGSSSANVTIAPDTIPPTVQFQVAASVTQGAMLPVTVLATDNTHVASVKVFVDGATTAYYTGVYAPYQFGLDSSTLSPGQHNLSAVAIDGAGNTAQAVSPLLVIKSAVPPALVITAPANASQYAPGAVIAVAATATDIVGISQVQFFLDAETAPHATSGIGFNLDTTGLALGNHSIRAVATDLSGNQTMASVGFVLSSAPPATPPAAPVAALIGAAAPAGGVALITGQAGAVAPGLQVLLVNQTTQASASVIAASDGSFTAQVEASGGNPLSLIAVAPGNLRSAATSVSIPAAATLVSLAVSPSAVSLNKTVLSQVLSVTGVYSDGSTQSLTGAVSYASANAAVATVSSAGLVLEGSNGATTISVAVAGLAPVSVPVTVTLPVINSVGVNPTTLQIKNVGFSQVLAVTAQYSDGTTQPYPGTLKFAAQDSTVAAVDSTGRVTGVAVGSTNVTVVAGAFTPILVPVTVSSGVTLVSISVSPASVTLIGQGQSQALTVTGQYSDNSTAVLATGVTFTSSSPTVAPVSSAGVVSAVANGTASITVATGSVAPVTVATSVKSPTGISLNPSSALLIGPGKHAVLGVLGTYSDGSTAPLASGVVFSSSDGGVATVDATGTVTSVATGTAQISASLAGMAATSRVTVQDRVATSLSVAPASLTLNSAGAATPLTVTLNYNDGTAAVTTTGVTFVSSSSAVATVDPTGRVTAVANGTATISVTLGARSAGVPVAVNIPTSFPAPVIASIDRPMAGEGDAFVIRGSNFASTPAGNQVLFNGLAAIVQAARPTELTAIVPRGASSGGVTVTVAGQTSNVVNLSLYGRIAQSYPLTGALTIPATGNSLTLSLANIDYHAGDVVYLSSAPDILAPVSFGGLLSVQVDGGTAIPVLTATSPDLTAGFVDGLHNVTATLTANLGIFQSSPLYLVVGPNGTGPVAGARTVMAVGLSLPTPVTFIGLTGSGGAPLADGTQVAVSASSDGFISAACGCYVSSAGGGIDNGTTGPDSRVHLFTVNGGRIDVLYDPVGATQLGPKATETAVLQVLPTDGAGNLTSTTTLATTNVTLTEFDTAATPLSQDSVVANGVPKVVTATFMSMRDSAGKPVPDGVSVGVSAGGGLFVTPNGCCYIPSAGGTIDNGATVADNRVRQFTVSGGRIDVQYDPSSVTLAGAQTATAVIQLVPATPSGILLGQQTFVDTSLTLSSLTAQGASFTVTPPSVLAIDQDYRVVATLTNIVDSLGNPVPDGTQVAVSAASGQFVSPDGCCYVASAGGTIVNGAPSSDTRVRAFSVVGGEVQIVYSSLGVALVAESSGQAMIQVLPATSAGIPIGVRTIATAPVTLTGFAAGTATATPGTATASGLSEPLTVSVSGIVDTAGKPVPDGAPVAVSTVAGQFVTPDGCCYIASAGGTIVNGAAVPADPRVELFNVVGGGLSVTYDPISVVPLAATQTITANVQLMPAEPSGAPIGIRAFADAPITLSAPTASGSNFTVAPTSLLAVNQDFRATATLTHIVDASGNLVPDGTLVAVSVASGQFVSPDGCCYVTSAGGAIINGTAAADTRVRLFTVSAGQVQIVYSSLGVLLGSGTSTTATLQVLPATPAGAVIGNRTFAALPVTLTGESAATISGPGTLATQASGTYVISGLADSAGNPLPDGATVAASVASGPFISPDGCCYVNSAGGTILNGTPVTDTRLRLFTVQGATISVTLQAPAQTGTTVLQLLPADASGNLAGNRTFAVQSIAITP
jgi:uncharacterized protein YjdB